MIEIWTDGSCFPNPGPGGWGYSMRRVDGCVVEDCAGERNTTNNRMELTAILQALAILEDKATVTVYSDSQYCVKGLTVWKHGWQKRKWHTKDGTPMPNRDLWMQLHKQQKRLRAQFVWVRGHNGNSGNERADRLAELGRAKAL